MTCFMTTSAIGLFLATVLPIVLASAVDISQPQRIYPDSEEPTGTQFDGESNNQFNRHFMETLMNRMNYEIIREKIISNLFERMQSRKNSGPASVPEMLAEIARTQQLLEAESRRERHQPSSLSTSKRQIRYHQCYFNPISCFRKRK